VGPPRPGDEILAGRLFRRIPNRRNRFDAVTHRPLIGAFRPRAVDKGDLSVHLEELASQETVLAMMAADPLLRFFGLCAFDVAAVRGELAGRSRVIYQPDATDAQLGHAHVVVTNLEDDALQAVLLRHARVLVEPQHLQ
jgi:hypothetical protein